MNSLDPTLALACGAVLGVATAQIGGPVSLNWRSRFGAIHERLRELPRAAPPVRERIAGAALMMALAAGGTLTAYAAEPSAPERLASQAAGVVGSGDQLSLRLRTPQGERTLQIGETFEDGWALQALTPAKATLVKDGGSREVGLNPTGAVAAAAQVGPPSLVTMAGMPDAATIQAAVDRALSLDPQAVERARGTYQSLSVDEAKRMIAYRSLMIPTLDRNRTAGGTSMISSAEQIAALGESGYADYWALQARLAGGSRNQVLADLAARPVTGPTSYYVPQGGDAAQVRSALGIDARGLWEPAFPDAQGGQTYSLVAGTAEQYAARIPAPDPRPKGPIFQNPIPPAELARLRASAPSPPTP